MRINGVTFAWQEPDRDGSGVLLGHTTISLGDEMASAYQARCASWPMGLASNLAMAALLGRAAMIGYGNGVNAGLVIGLSVDGLKSSGRWVQDEPYPGPHPAHQPFDGESSW